jgi:hypothetical protein
VTWEDFVAALCGMFMIPLPVLNDDKKLDVHWRCLKALLVKGGIDDPGTPPPPPRSLSLSLSCPRGCS